MFPGLCQVPSWISPLPTMYTVFSPLHTLKFSATCILQATLEYVSYKNSPDSCLLLFKVVFICLLFSLFDNYAMTHYSETKSNLTPVSGFFSPPQPMDIPPTFRILPFHIAINLHHMPLCPFWVVILYRLF